MELSLPPTCAQAQEIPTKLNQLIDALQHPAPSRGSVT
jgi:hypothetical protein